MEHVNQIAVLSFSGQVINLMRGQGALYHRLLPSNVLTEPGVKRQFQHPAFSPSGKYVSFAEMHFKDAGFVRSDALVFEVPKDPKVYGATDSLPLFDSGELPGAPFFLRFSPDEESLAMLCTSPDSESYTAIVMIEWGKYYRKDSWAGQAAVTRFAPRKVLTLMQGNPVFFTYTTSSPKNATLVAHCQKEVPDPAAGSMVNEKAVWMLQRQDTGGVNDFNWVKVCDSDVSQRWSTPICHSAGGGDNVLVVEDGWLTSKALSRWKRNADGSLQSKRLMKVKGQVQFAAAPDSSKVVVLEEDINIGHYALTVIEGEDALDPASSSMGNQYEVPNAKLTVAFWFSPDSTKVLCLTAAGRSKEDVTSLKSSFRVGLNSEMQWMVSRSSLVSSPLLSSPDSPDLYLCLCVGVQLPPTGAEGVRQLQAHTLLHEDLRALLQPVRTGVQPLGAGLAQLHLHDQHGPVPLPAGGQPVLPGDGQVAEPGVSLLAVPLVADQSINQCCCCCLT
jgi:hypothetical protein